MSEEQRVKEFLATALQDEVPQSKAKSIIERLPHERRKPWKGSALVAACLLVVASVASLQMPVIVRAFAQMPLVGDIYSRYIQESGMDIAYQAGLVGELNKSVTQNGITLTVLSAYSDATQGIVFLTFTSEDSETLEQLWSTGLFDQEILRGGRVAFGLERSSSFEYIGEENLIFGVMRTSRLAGLFGKKIGLRFKSRALGTVWEIAVPVQTVASSLNQVVTLNQPFSSGEDSFFIQSVTFAPSMTMVSYTQDLTGKPAPGKDSKEGAHRYTSTLWELRDADGNSIKSLGGRMSSDGKQARGELYFMPTDSNYVSLYFGGSAKLVDYKGSTPLKTGNRIETPLGALVIAEVEHNQTSTIVEVKWQADSKLKKLDAVIADANGKAGKLMGWGEHPESVTFSFEHEELSAPLELRVSSFYVHDETEQEVFEIAR